MRCHSLSPAMGASLDSGTGGESAGGASWEGSTTGVEVISGAGGATGASWLATACSGAEAGAWASFSLAEKAGMLCQTRNAATSRSDHQSRWTTQPGSPALGLDASGFMGQASGVAIASDLDAMAGSQYLIDFTRPEGTLAHLKVCRELGVKAVIGTTGFTEAQKAEIEQRAKVVQNLAKSWGAEKFDQIASELDDAFGGLADPQGKPKPATDAIFEADDPKALVEYLSDPEHADEAANIARMNAISAGRAIGKIEAKLAAMKAESKPQRSSAAAPLSAVRGAGAVNTAAPSDLKAYMAWANKKYGSI